MKLNVHYSRKEHREQYLPDVTLDCRVYSSSDKDFYAGRLYYSAGLHGSNNEPTSPLYQNVGFLTVSPPLSTYTRKWYLAFGRPLLFHDWAHEYKSSDGDTICLRRLR